MAFPYGASLQAFLESYDRAERQNLLQRGVELREALAVRQLSEFERQRREEEAALAEVEQRRLGRPVLPPMTLGIVPGQAAVPAVTAGGVDIGEPGEAVLQPAVAGIPPQSGTGLFPTPAGGRPPFAAGLTAKTLAQPRAQAVIRSVEESEKDEERQRDREEARQLFDVAGERFRAQDVSGGYEELAKAYNRLGLHGEGGRAIERAIALRQDKEDETQTNAWLGEVLKAEKAFTDDPSFATHGAFLEALGEGTSKTARAMRLQLVANQLKASLSRDPFSAILWKKMGEKYAAAWDKGEAPNLEAVVKDLHKENPGLLLRALGDELEKGKELPRAILKIMGVGEEIDPAKVKDFTAQAMQNFRAKMGRAPKTEDEFNTVWKDADRLAKARKVAEAEADPLKQELSQLNKNLKEHQLKVARGEVPLTPQQISLEVQRVQRVRKEAVDSGDPQLEEQAKALERYWIGQEAEAVRKRGGKIPKVKASVAERLLSGKKIQTLQPEEQDAVVLDIAQRLFPGKVRTAQDLAGLKKGGRERQAIQTEISRLEGLSETETE